ncbi:MAG: family 16 glycoside hydrolase [Pirellulaceae bacterium]
MKFALCLSSVAAFALCQAVHAEKNVDIKPTLAEMGSSVVNESFDNPMTKPFTGVKGTWEAVDGVLQGKELASDKHAAVLNYNKPNRNSVVRFSFKFDDNTKGFNFSLNHKGGHLFRVVVAPTKMTINLDKDKKDPKSKAEVLATTKADFQSGKWHTMQVEMLGDKVFVQTDNGATAKASHAKLDTDKPNYRFVMRGDTLAIDDLQIWELQ